MGRGAARHTWTAGAVAVLKELWAKGTDATEIGKEIGTTKNAVVSKAHRLGLSKHATAVMREQGTFSRGKRLGKDEPPRGPVADITFPDRGYCRWPTGDPRVSGFGFCGRQALPGKPYCDAHQRKAYRAPLRNEDG